MLNTLEHVVAETMIAATEKAVNPNVNNEGETSGDISVGIDGTWQKRGHIGLSLNGVESISSICLLYTSPVVPVNQIFNSPDFETERSKF